MGANRLSRLFSALEKRHKADFRRDPAPKHHADQSKIKAQEAEKLLSRIADHDWVVALDEHGRQTSSVELAERMQEWKMQRTSVALLIGGADGLDQTALARVQMSAYPCQN